MTVPVINAVINFSTGPSFAQTLILGEGKLDVNILGDATAVIVDVSNRVNRDWPYAQSILAGSQCII